LEREKELIRVREAVDWKYEIGERTREAVVSQKNAPAFLFEKVKDYPGHRVLTNGLGSYSRFAIALGLDSATSFSQIVQTFKERARHPIPPVMVEDGPVEANVYSGNEVDLFQLPVPWWSRQDGGRYIGTWHLNITKDPDVGVRNVGIYRMQIIDQGKTSISFSPKSHLARHLHKAGSNNQPLEMAVAIGVDETLIMAGAAALPYGSDEFHLAGGLAREPVKLLKCKTVDLEVPSSAEIVLEGKILPNVRIKEGPFLDYSGIPNSDERAAVFEVTRMIFRNNPIFRGAAIGIPGSEDHLLFSLLSRANYLDFHGSRLRQKIQNFLLAKGLFRLSQMVGSIRRIIKGLTTQS
jgi:4-hydroxy-3-polyprenylbenzoate decarboxylase